MHVRAFVEADWPLLEQLVRGMGFTDHASGEALRARAVRLGADRAHALLVAEREGSRVVGYAWAQDYGPHLRSGRSVVRLHDLFVGPDDRRTGVGRALFEAARDWAAQRGASWLQWQASAGARQFYERLGLVPTPSDDDVHPFYEIELKPRAG